MLLYWPVFLPDNDLVWKTLATAPFVIAVLASLLGGRRMRQSGSNAMAELTAQERAAKPVDTAALSSKPAQRAKSATPPGRRFASIWR